MTEGGGELIKEMNFESRKGIHSRLVSVTDNVFVSITSEGVALRSFIYFSIICKPRESSDDAFSPYQGLPRAYPSVKSWKLKD